MFRRAVHFAAYAMIRTMLVGVGLVAAASIATSLACRVDQSLAVCAIVDEALADIKKHDLDNSQW